MSPIAVFHGTENETQELVAILARHCTCATTRPQGHVCPVHIMAIDDQRAVDGLLFVRRTRVRRTWREWPPFREEQP